ncbi:MAG: hypothetical protein ACI8RZ_000210 [Myxococcota bacterium]|jgi:hypothetical protein
MKTVPCPACQRPNAPHRPRCMYCGEGMPQAALAPESRSIPENLDALIRAAMSGQGTEDLKAALIQASAVEPKSAVVEEVDELVELVDLDTSSLQPLDLLPIEPASELDAPSIPRMMPTSAISPRESTIDDGLRQLTWLLSEATSAWKGADTVACRVNLSRLHAQIPSLLSQLPAPLEPTPAPVPQPISNEPVRIFEGQGSWSSAGHPFALVVDCPGDAARAPAVARVLEVDGVTARMLAVSRYPRVALRNAESEPLQRLSTRYLAALGLGAAVIPRESLLDIDLPKVILGPAGLQGFRVCDAPLWLQPVHDSLIDGHVVRSPRLLLAVPGEVVTCHYRSSEKGARSRDAYQLSRESRIGVLDLHGPGVFLRVVEGATDFQGLPGYIVSSRRRSFRGLVDNIGQWFPGIQGFGSRVCRPTGNPHPSPDQPLRPRLEVNAWPMWEEHTRLCRLLLGIR